MALPLLIAIAVACLFAAWAWQRRDATIIYPPTIGLLYRDGRFERELPPGRYAWFDPAKRRRVVKISQAEQSVALPEVTVLSKDQFSFRLSLSPVVIVTDARLFAESQPIVEQHPLAQFIGAVATHPALYPSIASAALEAANTRTLAELMAAPAALTAEVLARIADVIPGAVIDRILLTAINLPPETRKMFTDVERARMEAQSALERARGEQAALRVLANAARMVDDNPALANLRLLQAIESTKGATTIILGESVAAPGGFPAKGRATSSS